eukprot:c25969_g1_i1 orf=514-1389(-)
MASRELKLVSGFITVFLCFVSPLISTVAADISPSNAALLGFVQSYQDPRYKISYHPPGSRIQRDPDQEIVVMIDGEKRKYECTLPREAERQSLKDEFSQQNSSSVSLMAEKRVSKTPDDLLSLHKDQCFYRHEGWWTFEFCSHKKLRQIHIENNKVIQEYDLGVYDSNATAIFHQNLSNVLLQKDHRSKSAAQRYHSHLYTNGTLCDLTSEPRETEVRFICSDTGSNMISSITEVSTCKYTLTFNAPVLCKHPSFQEERPRFLVIDCEEMPPEVDDVVISGLLASENTEEQ